MSRQQASFLDDPLLKGVAWHEGYKLLGGVLLYEKLGQGGMGAVYRGRHIRLNVDVAVKILALPEGMEPGRSDVARFVREAQTAAAVSHQNLVRVLDVDVEAGVHYIVMEFVDGESAADRLERKGPLPGLEAVAVTLGAADGLGAAHRRGIVHRDVKPDNVMIDKEGTVKVTDLGLAKAFGGEAKAAGLSMGVSTSRQMMGTPFYMSPEQMHSAKDVGPPADVWSLGVTLYELLTGRLPWEASALTELVLKVCNDPLPDIVARLRDLGNESVPEALCETVRKSLAKEPDERYADCAEVAAALRDQLASMGGATEGLLRDAEAGARKSPVAAMRPPSPEVMTGAASALMAVGEEVAGPGPASEHRGAPDATAATLPYRREAPPRRRRIAVAGAVAAGAAVLGAVVFLTASRKGREIPARHRPHEARAEVNVRNRADSVRQAVEAGELGLALARAEEMLGALPTREESHAAYRSVVEAEARALAGKDRLEDAIDLTTRREESQSYVRFDGLRRELLLGGAARLAEQGDYRRAVPVYSRLLRECRDDPEVMRAIAANTGPGTRIGGDDLARAAAMRLAELTEGPLDDRAAEVLVASFDHYHPAHEQALAARKVLAERCPLAASLVRPMLTSDDRNERVNALLLMRQAGALTPEEELGVDVKNLTALKTTDGFDRTYLEASLARLEEASSEADWGERKSALGLGRITDVAAFKSGGELADRVAALLAKAFLPEIRQSLFEWAEGDNYVLRPRAHRMIKAAGLGGDLDEWTYHARNLQLDDYTWVFECLHDAVGFFRGQAGGERAAEALKLLKAARETVAEHMRRQGELGMRTRRSNVEANLKALDEAIAAFEQLRRPGAPRRR